MKQTVNGKLNFKSRDFVHLQVHLDYSLLRSCVQLNGLVKRLKELEMSSCAITDLGNLYGAVSFYQKMKSEGLHPIIGYEAFLTFDSRFANETNLKAGEKPYYNLVLLAKNYTGYLNLVYLASKAFTEGFHFKPRIDLDLLNEKNDGLIAISTGASSSIWHYLAQDAHEKALNNVRMFQNIFGSENFFIGIQDHGIEEEKQILKKIVELAKNTQTSLVATNDVHYLNKTDAFAQEVLMAIGDGKTVKDASRNQMGADTFYLRSAEEMWEVFGKDFPDALTNTLKIAENCQIEFPGGNNLNLPIFPIPEDSDCKTDDEYFEKVVMEGFQERKRLFWNPMSENKSLKHSFEDYEKRIRREIETIRKMGFSSYFLIVWEFTKYAKQRKIPVGPGRGSAAGSLVAYCLGITDIDPLQYDLLFERFLNPERISMPDIDIDFCVRGRSEVIDHVTKLYGRESVCQIITFGTMASKAAIKDVGRALNLPLGEVEKVAKLIPPPVRGRNVSISQALEQVSELKSLIDRKPEIKQLVDLALRLEGCSRHTSVHAAGLVISPKPLPELVPVAISSKGELTSQFTMNDLEAVGLLKMDFLALTTLTIINDCLTQIKQRLGLEINWAEIPLDDELTMRLFGEGRTEAVFQFESGGMQEICRRLKPRNVEDLAALNALYRPGPLDGGMVDDFIARHRGEKQVQYIVPEMQEILENTYGILVYQEQIMQIAQKLGGYSLGEADMMRRAMGKKKREEMAKHSQKFISGAVANGISEEKAEEIFNLMAQFADYGFNKSHSVAYAYLAYQTAFLKAHYPAYFYASVLSNEAQDTAKIYKYSNEMQSVGVKLLPPDINESDADFTPVKESVRFGLNAIKGIGTSSVQAIISARNKRGKFASVTDFAMRIDYNSLNRRALESLISAGAFDSLRPENLTINLWRAKLFAGIEAVLSYSQRKWQDKSRGQSDLFDSEIFEDSDIQELLPDVSEWTPKYLSQMEKNAVGFYISNHPLESFREALLNLNIKNLADFGDLQPNHRVSLAGIISGTQVKYSKRGNRFCIFRIEDKSAGAKCLVWSEAYEKYRDILHDDEMVVLEGKIESSDGQELTVIVDVVKLLSDVVSEKAQSIVVYLPENYDENFLSQIFSIINEKQGEREVVIKFCLQKKIQVTVGGFPFRTSGKSIIIDKLNELGCRAEWGL